MREETKKSISGRSTGIIVFDNMVDDLHKGENTIIGGRPDMGKPMLALNMANNMAMD